MKVSYNWVQEYLDFPLPAVNELVKAIGSQLGEVEEVVDLGAKYRSIIVARIVSCRPVEDSDHLSVCFVDDGGTLADVERNGDGHVQVVCGAPNVREGLMVAWLPPGSTVPSSFDADPFVLGSRKLRGYISNGMLASPAELAVGDKHDGILELDSDAPVGADFAQHYGLDDHIITIENKMFTHRPDCFGILGVAREISGILGHAFTEPDWFGSFNGVGMIGETRLPLAVRNEVPELVPRFMAVALSGVNLRPSSIKLQTYLSRVGMRPISNIVDLTNYYMFLTGQPLHAYDYDKVRALDGAAETATLVARKPRPGETLTLLSGKEIEPRQDAILIATESQAIGLGGVMGGALTEIDSQTKNIILECATFEMYSIRRTSMQHGIFTEAVTRFNKGQSPLQNDRIAAAAVRAMTEASGAQVASELVDVVAAGITVNQLIASSVSVTGDFITARLGIELSAQVMTTLLTNVGFSVDVQDTQGDTTLVIGVPFWRTDIEIREDVVEEVGRLYGFDNLVFSLPKRTITPVRKNDSLSLKSAIRNSLSRAGANEVLTYSFVHSNVFEKAGQNKSFAYRLTNALSPDLQYYRLSLTPSLLDKIHANVRAGYDQFAIFEIGKAHMLPPASQQQPEVPVEYERLALVFAADSKAASKYEGAPYYQARAHLDALLNVLGLSDLITFHAGSDDNKEPEIEQRAAVYALGRSATIKIGDIVLGEVGEYSVAARKGFKLPDFTAGFEIDLEVLRQNKIVTNKYAALSKYPKVEQDICLRVASQISYAEVHGCVWQALLDVLPADCRVSVAPVDIYQPADTTDQKQVTLRITVVNDSRTMTDTEVGLLLDSADVAAKDAYGAVRI